MGNMRQHFSAVVFSLLLMFVCICSCAGTGKDGNVKSGNATHDKERKRGGYLGIVAKNLTTEQQEKFGNGVFVNDICLNSPAEKANLKIGSVIKSIDGKDANSRVDISKALREHDSGDKITLSMATAKEGRKNFTVELKEPPLRLSWENSKTLSEYRKKFREMAEDNTDAHYKLGLWCRENGLFVEARSEFEKALELNPDNSDARREMNFKKSGGKWVNDFSKLAEKIEVARDPKVDKKYKDNKKYEKILEIIESPENWEKMLKTIYDKIGIYRADWELNIRVVPASDISAFGGANGLTSLIGRDGENGTYNITITLNTSALIAAPEGYISGTITHELSHALTCPAFANWPAWLSEGSASYISGDGRYIIRSIKSGTLTDIDKPGQDPYSVLGMPYVRGYLFFSFIENKYGRESVKKLVGLVAVNGAAIRDSVEDITGEKWIDLKSKELEWSTAYLEKSKKSK